MAENLGPSEVGAIILQPESGDRTVGPRQRCDACGLMNTEVSFPESMGLPVPINPAASGTLPRDELKAKRWVVE